jgi:hypothetical protein
MNLLRILLCFSFFAIWGCSGDDPSSSHGSVHVHQAPRGGVLLELGPHGSGHNLELLENPEGKLEIYVLDAHAENHIRISQPFLELSLIDANRSANPLVLQAIADAATGETVGNTALFRSEPSITDLLPLRGKILSIAIGSKTYTAQTFEFSGNP